MTYHDRNINVHQKIRSLIPVVLDFFLEKNPVCVLKLPASIQVDMSRKRMPAVEVEQKPPCSKFGLMLYCAGQPRWICWRWRVVLKKGISIFFLREDWPMIIIIIIVPHHPAYVFISYHHNNFYLWTKNLWALSFLAWYTAVLIDGFIVHCFFEHGTKLELQKCNCSGALKKWWVQLMAMMLYGFTPLPPPKLPSGNLT